MCHPNACRFLSHAEPVIIKQQVVHQNTNLPDLAIVSTGGTIASRIDYRTGSVTSQFNASDILTAIPELKEIANYRTIPLATILSENMTPAIWQELARAVHKEIQERSYRGDRDAWYRYDGLQRSGTQFHDRYSGARRSLSVPSALLTALQATMR